MVAEWREQAAVQRAATEAADVKAHGLEHVLLQASLHGWHSVTRQQRLDRVLINRSRARSTQNRYQEDPENPMMTSAARPMTCLSSCDTETTHMC